MAQLILALVTPRAGEWNHRYIIPGGCSWNDSLLGEALQKIESSPENRYGICISDTVHQQGGREGTEKLFFYCDNFEYLSRENQNECHKILKDWFENQRDALIRNVNWASEGKKQTISRPELSGLYHDLTNLTASASQPSEGNEKKKNSCCLRGGCLMLAVVLGIGLALGLGDWGRAFQENFIEPIKETAKQVNDRLSGQSDTPNQADKNKEKDLTPFYDLFVWPEGSEKNENNLVTVFDNLWQAQGKAARPNLDAYLEEEGPILKLLEDKESGQNSPLVLPKNQDAKNPDNWKVLQGIDPQIFHKTIVQLKDMGWPFKIDSEFKPLNNGFEARFYYLEEWKYAKSLRDFLVKESELDFSPEESLYGVLEKVFSEKQRIAQNNITNWVAKRLKESKNLEDDDALKESENLVKLLKELNGSDFSQSPTPITP